MERWTRPSAVTDTIFMACTGKMFFNRIIGPKFLGLPGNLEEADKAEREELPRVLDYLEGVMPDDGFLVGDRLTLADLAVASPFVNLDHLNVDVPTSSYPKTARFVDYMLARPSFADSIAQEKAQLAA